MDHQETNKIFEALDYVKAGIQHRAKHRGVYFCNGDVKLPEETFIHVLGFLDKHDLIDNVSHVSYTWAKASLSPNVSGWQTIDLEERQMVVESITNHYYQNYDKKTTSSNALKASICSFEKAGRAFQAN